MKIVCPHCNTNYQIDDAKVPEKGLPVKCSACGNKFRVFREGAENEPELPESGISENRNDPSDVDSLFDSMPASSNQAADNLDALLDGDFSGQQSDEAPQNGEGSEDAGGIDIASYHDEISGAQQQSDAGGVSLGGGGSSDLDLASDRFDETDDSLFDDNPAQKGDADADALFSDAPQTGKQSDDDFDALFADKPAGTPSDAGKQAADDLFGDDAADDLFGDVSNNSGSKSEGTDDFLKELFGDAPAAKQAQNAQGSQKIYFRNKATGKVTGPVDESEVDSLMINGEISEDDDISYDGVNWNGSDAPEAAQGDLSSSGPSLGLDQVDDSMDSLLFEEGTAIHREENSAVDINFDDENSKVEHVYIPDEFSDTATGVQGGSPKKGKRRGGSPALFYAATSVATLAILAIIAGGAYYFYSKRNNSADILDNISEQIAVNTGTLADVREALDKDVPEDYINSIGILKQYIKPDDSAPSAVGLDGQVKMNLLISYNKKVESPASINDKIDSAMKNAQGNIDLVKAKALCLYEQKQYDTAAEMLQPFTDKNDQEVFYILGLIASGKNDLEKAENFFNTGFIQGGGKSVKIMYALANMKYQNGDTQSAMAFINRIISESPNYIKAYLLKSKILMNSENRLTEAEKFLKNIDNNVIAKAENFQKAEYYQMLASMASKRGNVSEAIGYYEKAVEINQTDTEAITKIADFYVQISDSTKAMEYYDMALKIDPKHASSIIGKTEVYVLLGQKEKIYLELAKLELKTLTNPELLARVAKIYSNIGDKAKAIEFYDLSIKSDPSYVEPYIAKAQILLLDFNKVKDLEQIMIVLEKLGKDRYPYHLVKAVIDHKNADYKSAAEHFKIANEKNSAGDERVYFFYGEFLKDQKKYAEATKMLLKAYKSDPLNYDYMQSYIDSLEKERKWKSVISELEQKTFVEKRMYKSYASLANSYAHVKDYEKALAAINRSLELDSQKTSVYYLKAKILYTMERYADAEKDIETAVVLDMKNFDNYMLYARILLKLGDHRGALEKIEAAEKLDPGDQDLMLMKGIVHKNLDEYQDAIRCFNKVTDKSLLKEAYLEIGESYLQLGKRSKAMDYLKKAERSGNRAAVKLLAGMYYDSGDTNKAINYYKKVLAGDRKDVDSMSKLGYIYKEKGSLAEALRYFKRCLKYVDNYNEKKMIEDEVYYIKQNLPPSSTKPSEKPGRSQNGTPASKAETEDPEDAVEEAEDLYEEGMYVIDEDPEEAKRLFQEVMKTVSKNNEFYKKAQKALNKIEAAESKKQKENEEDEEE